MCVCIYTQTHTCKHMHTYFLMFYGMRGKGTRWRRYESKTFLSLPCSTHLVHNLCICFPDLFFNHKNLNISHLRGTIKKKTKYTLNWWFSHEKRYYFKWLKAQISISSLYKSILRIKRIGITQIGIYQNITWYHINT